MRPFLLEDGDKDEVELVEKGPLRLQRLLRRGALDDVVNHKVADTWSQSASS